MILQLNPPIPVTTPKGKGLAHVLIDMGAEHNLLWVVFLDANGECWTFSNPDIRAQKNVTMGREYISPFYEPESVALPKKLKVKKCSGCGIVMPVDVVCCCHMEL